MLNGVFRGGSDGASEFIELPTPTDDALRALSQEVTTRTMKLLIHRGALVDQAGWADMSDNECDLDKTCAPSVLPFVCLAAQAWESLRWTTPEASHFYCLAGSAAGLVWSLGIASARARRHDGVQSCGIRRTGDARPLWQP